VPTSTKIFIWKTYNIIKFILKKPLISGQHLNLDFQRTEEEYWQLLNLKLVKMLSIPIQLCYWVRLTIAFLRLTCRYQVLNKLKPYIDKNLIIKAQNNLIQILLMIIYFRIKLIRIIKKQTNLLITKRLQMQTEIAILLIL
jgi:hypothetical protein